VFLLLSIGCISALIVYFVTSDKKIAVFTGFAGSCLYTISVEPISIPSAYAFWLGFGIICLYLSVLFLIVYNTSNKVRFRVLSAVFIFLGMYTYETSVLFLPA